MSDCAVLCYAVLCQVERLVQEAKEAGERVGSSLRAAESARSERDEAVRERQVAVKEASDLRKELEEERGGAQEKKDKVRSFYVLQEKQEKTMQESIIETIHFNEF
jgi:hypothetical protein